MQVSRRAIPNRIILFGKRPVTIKMRMSPKSATAVTTKRSRVGNTVAFANDFRQILPGWRHIDLQATFGHVIIRTTYGLTPNSGTQ